MLLGWTCTVMLLGANAAWDLACCLWMVCAYAQVEARPPHWALWADEGDGESPAARMLWIALVLQWGCVRVWAALTARAWWLAVATYEVEAACMLAGALTGLMRPERAVPAGALSHLCALAVAWLTMA